MGKNIKSFDQFVNESYNLDEMASFAGRAWSGKLSNLDDLFSWMYDKGILSKTDQAKKDTVFRQYYRYYNDGDFPKALNSLGISKWDKDENIEKALEQYVEEFMKAMLTKYAGKYDRKAFHFDRLLGQLYGLQNNLKFDPAPHRQREDGDDVFDYNVSSFVYFYKKLGKVDHPEFDKLVDELEKAYNAFNAAADKQIDAELKANPDKGGWGGLSTNKIFMAKVRDMKNAEIWTDKNQKDMDTIIKIGNRLYTILGDVIEATNKAKVIIG